MTIKKKLIVSTIAASLAATAFAGIPLSNKGLAEKLGFNATAYASAAAFPSEDIVEYVNDLYAALDKTGGLDEVQDLRSAIQALSVNDLKSIAQPITSNVTTKLGADFDDNDKAAVANLVLDVISVTYDPNLTELERIRNTDAYRGVLAELAVGAGFKPQQVDDLTVDDVADYFFTLQEKVAELLDGLTTTELLAALSDAKAREALIKDAFEALSEESLIVQDIFDAYGITTDDLKDVVVNVQGKVESDVVVKAAAALYAAYLKMNDTGGGGLGGGSVEEEVVVKVPQAVTDLINGFKDQLANASEAEKPALIAKAIAAAQALVKQLANQDLSKDVTVSGGTASLQVQGSSVLSAIAGIGELLKTAKELAPGVALPAIVLNINLGNIAQDDVKIGLNNAVIQEAIKAGLNGINLSVNGLNATLPVGGQFNGAVNFNINKSKADAAVTGGLQAASDVYSFGLTIGGQSVTSFAQPVIVSVPLGNVDGVDKELLSLAKIVDGKLVFQGGQVQGNSIIEHRDTFSSYVVVENKVTFSDIASVQAWAGRAINVIAAKGAIEGKSAGVFAPKDNVTRAEFAKMLTRALDLDNSLAKESFSDVEDSNWAAPYIGAAAKLGIINGRSASKFDPNAQITRAEMATMIARALKVTKGAKDVADVNAALASFKDAGLISASLKAGVAFASEHEIVIGNNGKFLPNASATRAEAAVMIYRAVNFK